MVKNTNMFILQLCILFEIMFCSSPLLRAQDGRKPNLLFIMTDQQRFDAMSVAGNTILKTPNLDRLAEAGAFFTNAYTPCAVCGPARSSILTGHTIENTGMTSNAFAYDYQKEGLMTMPTFDEVLSENGYHCEYYGKWHSQTSHADIYQNPERTARNGKSIFGSGGQTHIYRYYLNDNEQNRDLQNGEFYESITRFPYRADPIDKYYGMTDAELKAKGLKHLQPDQHGELLIDKENTITAYQAKQTIAAIERLKDKTFSITCSFHFPHSPMTPAEPYYSMYPPEDMIPPVSINDDMRHSPYSSSNGRKKNPEYSDPEKLRYMMSNYYGLIGEIDDWIGKILDKLDELGIADNTLVIFTSDHGEMLGAHGMREKNVFYEESAHVPLLVRFPGEIGAGTTVEGYTSLIDLFPTILDYLNIEEQPSDGTSLRGLIEGTDNEHGQYVVTEWDSRGDRDPNYMIIKDGWKLMIPYTTSSSVINALYDLNTDPYEMNNLLANEYTVGQYYGQVEELRSCLLEWLKKNNSKHYDGVKDRFLIAAPPVVDDIVEKFEKRAHTFEETTIPYRIFIPENYDPNQSYPLMLTLHDAGERGSDNEIQIKRHGLATSWADSVNQAANPCFVVAPQCPDNEQWVDVDWSLGSYSIDDVAVSDELHAVMDLLDKLSDEFNIDQARQYVTGISMGGYGTWDLIARYPERFAAAIPMSGAGDISKVEQFENVAIWNFHNTEDNIVPVEGSREMIEALKNSGQKIVEAAGLPAFFLNLQINNGARYFYTESPEGIHGPWDPFYGNPNLHKWVFLQSKPGNTSAVAESNETLKFKIYAAYPNPFNPTTTIQYSLAAQSDVSLAIYNTQGQLIKILVNKNQAPGNYKVQWNASNESGVKMASGIYFYNFRANSTGKDVVETGKMALMK